MNQNNEIIFTELPGVAGNVGCVTLNRPQTLNAMTTHMCQQLDEKLKQWETDKAIKAVVIRGNGERAFCAGGDIRHFYERGHTDLTSSKKFFWHEYRLNRRVFHFPKPYIALMHGITMGGGAGVSIHGSHRIAAENFIFAMPETGIGFHPDIGACYFLPRCMDKTGWYLGLTGMQIKADDAHHIGIVDAIVAQKKFSSLIEKLCATALGEDPCARVTEIINAFVISPNPAPLAEHRVAIDHCFSQNSINEILTALQTSHTPWAKQIFEILQSRSPTSLLIAFRQLQESSTLSFDECIRLDYRITLHFLQQHDFYEGIRAAIIDKDRQPKWQPATLSEINPAAIDKYFAPLEERELTFD